MKGFYTKGWDAMLGTFEYGIANTYVKHKREAYSLLDFIGDIGGVLDVIIMFIALVFAPFSEHSFIVNAVTSLYRFKTQNLEAQHVDIGYLQFFYLFFARSCCGFICKLDGDPKRKKLRRLINKGQARLEEEMNIEKIIREVRELKIASNAIIDDKTKKMIEQHDDNIIDMDVSAEEDGVNLNASLKQRTQSTQQIGDIQL